MIAAATVGVLGEVAAERGRQDARWGPQNHHPLYWLGILAEEVGEFAKDTIERGRLESARGELIQVAAVAVAAIESLDRNELSPTASPPA